MPTLIDAFYVELGLDPTQFRKGQKEATESFKKTKEEVTKSGKDIEQSAQKAADSIKKIAIEALALFAIFTGSRSIADFATSLITADAALGRFSKTAGLTPQYVGAFEKLVGSVGGTAEATARTIAALSQAVTDFRVNGTNFPPEFWRLQADAQIDIPTDKGMVAYIDGLSAALQKLYQQDPQKAALYANALHIDSGTLQLMIQYGSQLSKVIDLNKDLAPSDADVKNAQEFQKAWNEFANAIGSLFQKGFREVEPILVRIAKGMSDWVEANKGWLNQKVDEYATEIKDAFDAFMKWISSDDGKASLKQFGQTVMDILGAIAQMAKIADNAIRAVQGQKVDNGDGTTSRHITGADIPQSGKGSREDPYDSYEQSKPGTYYKGFMGTTLLNHDWVEEPKTGRATGGPVTGGQAYLVGEHGPEPFIPNTSGTILPNSAFGSDLAVDGRKVDRGNPVPVTLSGDHGGGENWLQTLGRWLGVDNGGGSAPGAGGSGGGGGFLSAVGGAVKTMFGGGNGSYNPVPGKPGQYRPVYTLSGADLSDDVVNIIAGEATSSQQSVDAVINNMFNRLGTKGYGPSGDLRQVALAPGQYAASRFRKAGAERAAFIRDRIRAIASGSVPDITNGANEYRAGWYNGPWGQRHRDAPVIGGNRFAYNPRVARGPYAPYEHPNVGMAGQVGGSVAGARFSALYGAGARTDNRRSSTSSSQVQTNVTGPITIHTKATDSPGIAASLKDALHRTLTASAANYGPG